MGIAYLYIKQYKNIVEQEFNFSSRFKFHYEKGLSTLEVEVRQQAVEDLFGPKIYNVNAIIGENGTGKSALLEFILGEVSIGKKNQWRAPFILVMEDDKTIWHHEDLPINHEMDGWTKQSFPFEIEMDGSGTMPLNRNLFFYYSNIYDGIEKEFQTINSNGDHTFIDLSTNHISEFYKELGRETPNSKKISNFSTREIDRYVQFILGWRAEQEKQRERGNTTVDKYNIPFRIPTHIKIKPSTYIDADFLINALNGDSYIIPRRFENDIQGIYDYLSEKHTFKHSLVLSILFGFFNQTPRISILQGGDYPKILAHFKKHDLSRPKELIDLVTNFGSIQKQFLVTLIEEVLNTNNIFEEAEELVLELTPDNETLINQVLKFVDDIYIRLSIQVFLDFGFSPDFKEDGLSTGEKSWLTLFSRFWIQRNNFNVHGQQSIIVLLDEPELGFHPNWQRKFIQQLLYFVTTIFGWIQYSMDNLNRKIQYIITSHSPFLISDLPKQSVTFLSKTKEGFSQASEGIKTPNTFAANIHTLLSDAFFMEEGLVGEFAKNTINDIFRDLYRHKDEEGFSLSSDRIAAIKKIIPLVGEPLVAKKLAYLFDEAFNANLEDNYIQKQIDYWQKLKNSRDNNDSN